jgi:NAD(P)-dependent dehydrogenase (short-subunit alcohol dehydrogenase family)
MSTGIGESGAATHRNPSAHDNDLNCGDGEDWAVITGGSRGIGYAIASRYVSEGGNVMIVARDRQQLESAKGDLLRSAANGQRVEVMSTDVSDPSGVKELFTAVRSILPAVTSFVANAGGGMAKAFLELTSSDWLEMIHLNLLGPALCCQEAAQFMIERKMLNQSIIVVSSIRAGSTLPGRAIYASTKAAVNQLVRIAAVELAPFGIRVNALAPGITRTTLAQNSPETFRDAVAAVPLGRAGEPDEMASAAMFLMGGTGKFITGSIVTVDGGESLVRS